MAAILAQAGRDREAIAEYSLRRSLGLDPGNAAARAALSRVAGRVGR